MIAIKLESLKKKNEDLLKVDSEAAAVQRLKWEKSSAKRAAKSAGLVEQAKNISCEYDAINALANFDANYHTKGYRVLADWSKAFFDAIDYEDYPLVWEICEKDFLDSEPLTVGEYLSIKSLKTASGTGESYADEARRIGDFWQFTFKIGDELTVAQ